jgi:hypothetical protein
MDGIPGKGLFVGAAEDGQADNLIDLCPDALRVAQNRARGGEVEAFSECTVHAPHSSTAG